MIHGITVTEAVIYATDGAPELRLSDPFCRVRSLFAAVRMAPFVRHHFVLGVRGIKKDVIGLIRFAGLDIGYLLTDLQQDVAETVNLLQGLALRRLHHKGAVYREREGWRVVTVVHQTLGDVRLGDADGMELAAVEDQLMTYPTRLAGIDDAVRIFETGGHIVRREDGCRGSVTQALSTHHGDIAPGDQRHIRVAVKG